jgi:hypothetical protein
MPILGGLALLLVIYLLYKMFIDGWLFKGILFFAGWFGLYVGLAVFTDCGKSTAFTLDSGSTVSWAAVVPTVICLLCLLCTRVSNE